MHLGLRFILASDRLVGKVMDFNMSTDELIHYFKETEKVGPWHSKGHQSSSLFQLYLSAARARRPDAETLVCHFEAARYAILDRSRNKKVLGFAEWIVVVRFKEFHEANEIHTKELLSDSARSVRYVGTFCVSL